MNPLVPLCVEQTVKSQLLTNTMFIIPSVLCAGNDSGMSVLKNVVSVMTFNNFLAQLKERNRLHFWQREMVHCVVLFWHVFKYYMLF